MTDEKTDRMTKSEYLKAAEELFNSPAPRIPAIEAGNRIERVELFQYLSTHTPLSDELEGLMAPPEHLYVHGDHDWPSWSSDENTNIVEATAALLLRRDLPLALPEYGIGLMSRGSNVFCALIDSRRKIAVAGSIFNMYARGYSWWPFEIGLQSALEAADAKTKRGEQFRFVQSVI